MIALEPGQQWLSQFRLLKELVPGRDKRPRVWLAEKQGSSNKIVLKFLRPGPPSPQLVRRLADWRATHVDLFMPLLGVHSTSDQMALELPYVADDNASLRGSSYTRWSIWLEQVIDVVAALHRDNFIHGDIKLGNIRRDASGRPMLSDPWLPGDGRSPYTASPERMSGGSVSVPDDLYALGALMHELITGYPPKYPGLDQAKQTAARLAMPPEAADAMNALLSATPSQRPSLDDLRLLLSPLNNTHPQEEDAGIAKPAAPPSPRAPTLVAQASPSKSSAQRRPFPENRASAPVRTPTPLRPAAPPVKPSAPPRPQIPVDVRQASQPVIPEARPRLEADSWNLRESGAAFEPAPLQVGSPTWERPSARAGITAQTTSPFPSRTSTWLWPLLLILVGGAAAAFVWLPKEVKQPAIDQLMVLAARLGILPAQQTVVPAAPTDPQDPAAQKLAAEQLRDRAAELEQGLIADGAMARPIPAFVAGSQGRKQGLADFYRGDFIAAATNFRDAVKNFGTARQALPQLHAQALAAGNAALAQCLREAALAEYRYALQLQPRDSAAREGIARVQACGQADTHAGVGPKVEEHADAAAMPSQAGAPDAKSPAAPPAQDAVSTKANEDRFSRQLAAAVESLRRHRYSAAATAIAAADRLRPNSPDVQRLSAQLDEVRSADRLQALRAEATEDEREERWSEALDAYRAMLAVDGTLIFARDGAQRSEDRMKLDAELAGYIDNPDRLSADEVRGAANAALARSRVLEARGPRIETQISRIAVLLSQFDSEVQVALTSDGLTEVVIYRVGRLGTFTQRAINLRPGRYTLVGSRLGYRDVRRELTVLPGQSTPVLEIRCEEQI